MSVAAPERKRTRRGNLAGLSLAAVTGLVLVGLALVAGGAWLAGILPGLDGPFEERGVDRSPPALLRSLEPLREYRAATANFETIVDLERDTANVPSFLKGERTLFVAVGSVDAGVDFSRLRADALDVSADRRAVTVSLPRARPLEPRVDPARSRVFERDRGLIDRLGGVFEDNPTSERELYLLAERKLAAAARDPASGLVPSAERNTRVMLEGLMRGLGFERVAVRFG
ncbi:MAG: hypothetical protein AVDCRST_MAG17-2069 [uncultured Solirubrobacterales bacterium]|uniref:DUF4230 domain-containing protein n=1 Tax=uncultured Solirubrobacterales bacterium TaxID=768556 RepID=A0A6J4T2Z4_9ACTN|nr:MAG: hypothetical protein AVDCRST_MAG17-2069 [uncultured Solirubrobacterales bacterium]